MDILAYLNNVEMLQNWRNQIIEALHLYRDFTHKSLFLWPDRPGLVLGFGASEREEKDMIAGYNRIIKSVNELLEDEDIIFRFETL